MVITYVPKFMGKQFKVKLKGIRLIQYCSENFNRIRAMFFTIYANARFFFCSHIRAQKLIPEINSN